MARWLKQSTSVDVPIGPFVDQTDGFTAETALTLTQPDIRLKKDGGAWAQKNAAQTLSHEENGYYEVTLDATDTNTLGLLRLAVNESGALPVFEDFLVVPANVWDSLFSTDLLQIDVAQWLGTAAAAPTIAGVPEVDLTHWLGSAPLALLTSRVQANSTLSADGFDNNAIATNTGLKSIRTATAQGGAANSITLDAGASAVDDFYKGTRIYLTSSTGAGQSRLCTGYNGTTKAATIEPDWITNPAAGSQFAIRDNSYASAIATGGIVAGSFAAGAINAAAIAPGAIDDDAVAADMDSYHAKVWVVREGATTDHYAVIFFKNGQPVTTGITSPTIQVIKASDGTDLIASTALTEVGALGIYKKDESTNKLTGGAIYFAKVQATIDGSTRQWLQQIGRDSI